MKTTTRLLALATMFLGPAAAFAQAPSEAREEVAALGLQAPTPEALDREEEAEEAPEAEQASKAEEAPKAAVPEAASPVAPALVPVPLEELTRPSARPITEPAPEKVTIVEPKKSVLTFEGDEILGAGGGPNLDARGFIDTVLRARHANLIQLRDNFDREIQNSFYGLGG